MINTLRLWHQRYRFHPHGPSPLNQLWSQNRRRRILFLLFPRYLPLQQMAFFRRCPNLNLLPRQNCQCKSHQQPQLLFRRFLHFGLREQKFRFQFRLFLFLPHRQPPSLQSLRRFRLFQYMSVSYKSQLLHHPPCLQCLMLRPLRHQMTS